MWMVRQLNTTQQAQLKFKSKAHVNLKIGVHVVKHEAHVGSMTEDI